MTTASIKRRIKRLEMALEAAKRREVRERTLHVLDVAMRYATWMDETGIGDTYSTFCDDFGYEAVDGEDRTQLHRRVIAVIMEASSDPTH